MEPIFLYLCAFTIPAFGDGQNGGLRLTGNRHHPDNLIARRQRDAPDSTGRSSHRTDIFLTKANDNAHSGAQENFSRAIRDIHADEPVAFLQGQRNNPALPGMTECSQIGFFDIAFLRRHHDILVFGKHPDRQGRGDPLALADGQQIHNGFPFAGPPDIGQLIHFKPVHATGIGKEQQVIMR